MEKELHTLMSDGIVAGAELIAPSWRQGGRRKVRNRFSSGNTLPI